VDVTKTYPCSSCRRWACDRLDRHRCSCPLCWYRCQCHTGPHSSDTHWCLQVNNSKYRLVTST